MRFYGKTELLACAVGNNASVRMAVTVKAFDPIADMDPQDVVEMMEGLGVPDCNGGFAHSRWRDQDSMHGGRPMEQTGIAASVPPTAGLRSGTRPSYDPPNIGSLC